MDNLKITRSFFCASVFYPNEDQEFDFDLYSQILAPQYAQLLGENCIKFEVRRGLQAPGLPAPPFVCTANFWVNSGELFGKSMADPRMNKLMEKISSFTAIIPIRQFEEILPRK